MAIDDQIIEEECREYWWEQGESVMNEMGDHYYDDEKQEWVDQDDLSTIDQES